MKKILIVNTKGGSSKSILSLNIAYALAESQSVCLADLDPQGSLASLRDLISIPVVNEIELNQNAYDYCIIDSPPYLSDKLTKIMDMVDYILIPVRPSHLDVMATKTIINLLPQKPCGIVLTQVPYRVNLTEVLELLQQYKVPVLKTHMTQRVAYARSIITPIVSSDDEKAQNEILSITLEIISKI